MRAEFYKDRCSCPGARPLRHGPVTRRPLLGCQTVDTVTVRLATGLVGQRR